MQYFTKFILLVIKFNKIYVVHILFIHLFILLLKKILKNLSNKIQPKCNI
jgi:hypothetical protein